MPGLDANTKLLIHANGSDGIKSAFSHMKLEDNTDEGTGANAVSDIGTPTYTSGKIGNALTLDGSTDALNIDALEVDVSSDTIGAISVWVNFDTSSAMRIVQFGDTDALEYVGLYTDGSNHFAAQCVVGGISQWYMATSGTYTTGTWYHLVLVQDGVSPKMYLNSSDVTNLSITTDTTAWMSDCTNLDNGRLGCGNINSAGNYQFFDGQIDDFRYYKCALSQQEINILYNSSNGTENSIITDATNRHTAIQTQGDAQLSITYPFSHMAMENNTDDGWGANAVSDIGTPTYTSGKLNNALTIDGSTDALTVAALAADIDQDDVGSFAFWINPTDFATVGTMFTFGDNNAASFISVWYDTNSKLNVGVYDTGVYQWRHQDSSGSLTASWQHIIIVHDGVSPKIYRNGSDITNLIVNTSVTAWFSSFAPAELDVGSIGRTWYNGIASQYFKGQIDDFRYYKNHALSSEQISGLYASGSGTEDNVVNSKWGTNSFTFDGTGDYISIPDSADWDIFSDRETAQTIDFWVKHDTHAGYEQYINHWNNASNNWYVAHGHDRGLYAQATSGGEDCFNLFIISDTDLRDITDTNWHHVAIIKNINGFIGLYLDGIQVAQAWMKFPFIIGSSTLEIGRYGSGANYFDGNMDEIRVQANNYFSAAPNSFPMASLLIYGEGTDEDTSTDNEGYGGAITFNGTAKLDNGTTKFNPTTSLWFDGDSDYLTVTDTSGTDYDIVGSATSSWTIDLWVNHNAFSGATGDVYLLHDDGAGNRWNLQNIRDLGLYFNSVGGATITCASSTELTSTGVWYHVALIKSGANYGIYLDGTQIAYTYDTDTQVITGGLTIGRYNPTSSNYFNGYMEQVQITNGNKFGTVPIPEPNTHFKMNDNAANTTVTDNGSGANNGTLNGGDNTQDLSATGKINNALHLNGTDDYIDLSNFFTDYNTDQIGSISVWINPDTNASSGMIFQLSHSTADRSLSLLFSTGSNQINCYEVDAGESDNWNILSTSNAAPDNTWTHVVLVQDGISPKLYINGVFNNYSTIISNNLTTWFGDLSNKDVAQIGVQRVVNVTNTYFDGQIDDFRYYSGYVLTESQVADLYNSGSGTEEKFAGKITVPTEVLTQDTITVPTAEYSAGFSRSQCYIIS